jgi:hypothetical protein
MILFSLSVEKCVFPCWFGATSCTPLKSNLYFDSSFSAVSSEPAPIQTSNIPCLKSHVLIPSLMLFVQGIRPSPRLIFMFRNRFIFYGEGLLLPRPTRKLEDHPLSFVRGCLFNVFQVRGSFLCFVTGW